MPTYGYECKSCKHTFDVFQSMKDDPIKSCPLCKKPVRRLINGGNGVIFKGSGFYVTDKGKSASGSGTARSTTESTGSSSACESCPVNESGNKDACAAAAGS